MPQLRLEGEVPAGFRGRAPLAGVDCADAPVAPFGKLKPGPGRSAAEVARHQRARIRAAMVEIVAERGYAAVTVRELARTAGISTRTFYQRYSSKEECFLDTHQWVVRRLLRGLETSQTRMHDREEGTRLAVRAIVDEWAREPKAARLMLIDAYVAGPTVLKQARRASQWIETGIDETFEDAPKEGATQRLVAEGIVAGITGVVRARLLGGQKQPWADLSDALAQWAFSYRSPFASQLEDLYRVLGSRDCDVGISWSTLSGGVAMESAALTPIGDRSLLLSAVARIAASEDRQGLTMRRILAAAGVPRRSFDANFSRVEDCFVAALELWAGEAITRAKRVGGKGLTAVGGVYQVVTALCAQVAQDPILAGLCFGELAVTETAKMRHQHQIIGDIGGVIESTAKLMPLANELATEASAAALWGLLGSGVATGRALRAAPQFAANLACLVLAPVIGAKEAVKAVREECVLRSQE